MATHVSDQQITAAARAEGVDPALLKALVKQESGGQIQIGSPAGARGPTQLMPDTAKSLGVTNIDDPVQNLRGGAKYLKQQLDRFGKVELALAAYNAGPGAVAKYGGVPPYAETQGYVKNILGTLGSHKVVPLATGKSPQPVSAGQASSKTVQLMQATQRPSTVAERMANALDFLDGKKDVLDFAQANQQLEAADAAPAVSAGQELTVPGSGAASPPKPAAAGSGTPASAVSHQLIPTMQNLDRLGQKYGAIVTAKQEPGHQPGGDHDPAVKGASARDFGGGEAQRKALFERITKDLGVKGAQYKGADINVTVGGLRYQIISRDHGTGPHLHVGVRQVG